jgi:aspartate aminotransferase-like enzyme
VDAISNFGGDELPVDELKVDFCIAGSQKCLAAPPGLVIVSISPRARAHIESNKERPTQYFNLPGYFKFYERFETPFTPAVPLLFALDEAFSIILEEGMVNRIARHQRCSDAFYAAFEAMGLQLFAREGVRSRSVIAVEYPEGIEDAKFRGLLEKHFGVVITGGFGPYRGKLFRVGSMGEVSSSHVYTTVSAIGRGLTSFGFRVDLDSATEKAGKLLGG